MKSKVLLVIIVVLSGFIFITKADAQGNDIAIIVNRQNPVNELSVSQVKLYFLKKIKLRWPETNKAIMSVDRKDMSGEKIAFYSKVLKMSLEDVEQYFVERQLSNAVSPPVKKSSENEIVDFVESNEGAIGYISKKEYELVKGRVKAVLIVN